MGLPTFQDEPQPSLKIVGTESKSTPSPVECVSFQQPQEAPQSVSVSYTHIHTSNTLRPSLMSINTAINIKTVRKSITPQEVEQVTQSHTYTHINGLCEDTLTYTVGVCNLFLQSSLIPFKRYLHPFSPYTSIHLLRIFIYLHFGSDPRTRSRTRSVSSGQQWDFCQSCYHCCLAQWFPK